MEEEEEEVDGRRHRDGFGLCPGSTQPGKGNRPNPSFVCPSIRPRQTPPSPPLELVRTRTVSIVLRRLRLIQKMDAFHRRTLAPPRIHLFY